MEKESKQTQKQRRLHIEIVRQMLTLATAGFGLVAALAWNSAIQELVTMYVKKWFPQGGVYMLFFYAIVVTILAVLITLQLSKLIERLEEKEAK